jgi:hypothetical protein
VLIDVGESLSDQEVDRGLGFGRVAPAGGLDRHRHRAPRRQAVQSRAQPALSQDPRVQPGDEVPQFVQPLPGRLQGGAQVVDRGERVYAHALVGQLEVDQRDDQPLLGPIVDVTLEPAPGLVTGGNDPRSGCDELGPSLGVGHRDSSQLGQALDAFPSTRPQHAAGPHHERTPLSPLDYHRGCGLDCRRITTLRHVLPMPNSRLWLAADEVHVVGAQQLPSLGADRLEDLRYLDPARYEGRGLTQGPLLFCQPAQCRFRLFGRSQVADGATNQERFALNPAKCQLDRELAAVGAHPRELDTVTQREHLARRHETGESLHVRRPHAGRDDELGHGPTHHFIARITKHPLG